MVRRLLLVLVVGASLFSALGSVSSSDPTTYDLNWAELPPEGQRIEFTTNLDGTCSGTVSIVIPSEYDEFENLTVRYVHFERLYPLLCFYQAVPIELNGLQAAEFYNVTGLPLSSSASCEFPCLVDIQQQEYCRWGDAWTFTGTEDDPRTRVYVGIEFCYDGGSATMVDFAFHCLTMTPWFNEDCPANDSEFGPGNSVFMNWDGYWADYTRGLSHWLYALVSGAKDGSVDCDANYSGQWDGDVYAGCGSGVPYIPD